MRTSSNRPSRLNRAAAVPEITISETVDPAGVLPRRQSRSICPSARGIWPRNTSSMEANGRCGSVVDYLARVPNDPIMNLVSLAKLIGPNPPRCPLNPKILSNGDCGGDVCHTDEYPAGKRG